MPPVARLYSRHIRALYHGGRVPCRPQHPNCQCELAWNKARAASDSLNQLQAFDLAHECWDTAYSKKYIVAGWRACGLQAKE